MSCIPYNVLYYNVTSHGKYDVCPAYINGAVSGSLATTPSGTIGS